ncbi:MAG: hypothetical protein ACFFDN_48220 [Candidatus Hodarchaeota archaeon]
MLRRRFYRDELEHIKESEKIEALIVDFLLRNTDILNCIVEESLIIIELKKHGFSEEDIKHVLGIIYEYPMMSYETNNEYQLQSKLSTKLVIIKYEIPPYIKNRKAGIYYGIVDVLSKFNRLCIHCASSNIAERFGEIYCCNCGNVLSNIQETVLDYRNVITLYNPQHIYNPYKYLLANKTIRMKAGLYSMLYSQEIEHLNKFIIPELTAICDKLYTPSIIIKQAIYIYRLAYNNKLIKQKIGYEPYLIASIVLAYRMHKIPTELIPNKKAKKAMKVIIKTLGAKLTNSNKYIRPLDPIHYIPFILSRTKIMLVWEQKMHIEKKAEEILKKYNKILSSKHPRVVAATVLYLASKELKIRLSQKKISRVAMINNSSVSRLCSLLKSAGYAV